MAQGKTDGSNWMANKVSDTKENYFTVTYFTTLCYAASTCLPATKLAERKHDNAPHIPSGCHVHHAARLPNEQCAFGSRMRCQSVDESTSEKYVFDH